LRISAASTIASLFACLLVCAVAPATALAKGTVPPIRTPDDADGARTVPHKTSLNLYQKQRIESFLSGTAAVPLDTLRVLAFQVQFADSVMGGQPGSQRKTVHDSTYFANELRHLEQYYRGASRGLTEIAWTLEGRLYTLPEEMGYYGNDRYEDIRVVELAQTLIDSADADVDFSLYDTVFMIHAGAGQETDIFGENPEQLWSSFYDLGDIQSVADSLANGLVTGDSLGGEPFYVRDFCILPEAASQHGQLIGALGIWAFEAGSRLGLLPMFDSTPPGFTDSQGAGNFCVMAYGLFIGPKDPARFGRVYDGYVPAFPCVFNRLIAGWVDPVTLEAGDATGPINIADINTGADTDTVCVKIPITDNEYYLVVNRVHDADFDSLFTFGDRDSNLVPNNTDSFEGAEFDFHLTLLTNPSAVRYDDGYGFDIELQYTGSGIYVWHIDENVIRQNTAAGHLLNDFVDRKGADLEEADGVQDLDAPGFSGFMFGNHFDSFRAGDGNATTFGPETTPNTSSNGRAASGILIENVSVMGRTMTFELSRAAGYSETRKRWTARGEAQPGATADIDGDGDKEIVVLADTGLVYVFNHDGTEYNDADADTNTIAPYITVPGAIWAGPPATGNLDAVGADEEIVAAAADGRLFAWKGDGTPITGGALFVGRPIAAPPLLIDFNADGRHDVAIVERSADSLHVSFIAPDGTNFWPDPPDQTFAPLWPVEVQGHYAAPLALARTKIGETDGQTGVVLAWVDTLSSTANTSFTPVMWSEPPALAQQPTAQGWTASWAISTGAGAQGQLPSAPAAGDIDVDGYDEVVMTTPDGRLLVFDDGTGSNPPAVTALRGPNPTAPALGDVDLDGTLEIALWDDEYLYLKKSNGSDLTNWPIVITPEAAGEQPPNEIARGLESPAIGDVDGDGAIEAIYPLLDGVVYGFEYNGAPAAEFPRVGPAGAKATPSVGALEPSGAMSLVIVGFTDAIGYFDNVVDTTHTTPTMTLAIQGLTGSSASGRLFWPAYQVDGRRQGLVTEGVPLETAPTAVRTETFMIYPNPVPEGFVHARITLDAAAQVVVEIFNLEGERAFKQEYAANTAGLIDTPFDETIDVSGLKSGVYFMRLEIVSGGASEKLMKTFAVRR
jgi:M6 family metalloprotease-like protein